MNCAGAQGFAQQVWFQYVRPHRYFVRPHCRSVCFFWFVRPHREFVRSHWYLDNFFLKPLNLSFNGLCGRTNETCGRTKSIFKPFSQFFNPILPQICCRPCFWYRYCMQTTISPNKSCKSSILTQDLVNQNLFQTVFPFLRFSPNFNPNFPHFCL